jgi:hypothetical protein
MTTRSSPEHPAGLVTLLLTPIGGIAASRQQTHRFLADRGRTDYSQKRNAKRRSSDVPWPDGAIVASRSAFGIRLERDGQRAER